MSSPLSRSSIPAAVFLLGAPLSAQVIQCVSVSVDGSPTNGYSFGSAISADGRYVAFGSSASNFVPGDTNGSLDVFVRDRTTGMTERVSVDSAGVQGNGWSGAPSISADGRYVAFESSATNLVAGDTNSASDIFLRDRQTGTTIRVSVAADGSEADGSSWSASISADGRYVAFASAATNLVPGDTNGVADVFVRDLQSLTTERASVATDGHQGDFDSRAPVLSADGRYVAFASEATNLVAGDTNLCSDVFVRDRQLGTTIRASVATNGLEADNASHDPSISANGRFVTYWSDADNLVPNDTNAYSDVFLYDLQSGTTELASVGYAQQYEPYPSPLGGAVSDDGRYVAFLTWATNWDPGSPPYEERVNVFLRDRQSLTTIQVSTNRCNIYHYGGNSVGPLAMTNDGRFVAFATDADDLIPEDENAYSDVYVYDRIGAPNFTSLCSPGIAGVRTCPCGNPPSGPGRGCNNSGGTGGASLAAMGGAFLSSDTLQFTTIGERLGATSVLLQGTSSPAGGAVYGQGVRCVGGTLKRLYKKSAPGGSFFAPDWPIGEPPVSTRSAAIGNPILPGQSRWYLVFYRDPIVPGGCPAASTFNATQTGLVSWAP